MEPVPVYYLHRSCSLQAVINDNKAATICFVTDDLTQLLELMVVIVVDDVLFYDWIAPVSTPRSVLSCRLKKPSNPSAFHFISFFLPDVISIMHRLFFVFLPSIHQS